MGARAEQKEAAVGVAVGAVGMRAAVELVARVGRREAAVAVGVGAVGMGVAEAMAAGAEQAAVGWAGVE